MVFHIKDGGSWKAVSKAWVKDGGTWKEVQTASIRDGGTWKECHSACVITVASSAFAQCFSVGSTCTASGTVAANTSGCSGWAGKTFLWTVISNPGGLSFSGTSTATLGFSKVGTATVDGNDYTATVQLAVNGEVIGTVAITTAHTSF